MPRIVEPTDSAIAQAVGQLRAGKAVAFPTETVYGLGVDTFNITALELIYQLKGRPADNPLIAHVLDVEQARELVLEWDERCDRLTKMFWPGPLTLVLPKISAVPARATAGHDTIAVRAPAHPVARRLLQGFGSSLSAPSANRSGRVSPTRADHVAADFADADDLLILDGGPCQVGIESTVLDMTQEVPRVLRAGGATIEQLQQVLGEVRSPSMIEQAASPGTSPSHYAPATPVELIDSKQLQSRLAASRDPMAVLCFDVTNVPPPHQAIIMPDDAEHYARKLYMAMRQADALGLSQILIERPPDAGHLWRAVHDRLSRASKKHPDQPVIDF